jgi:hypothetical protein
MTFIAWPEIDGFHNVRKYIRIDPNAWWATKAHLSGTSTVSYKAKVKLHGTNAAVQILPDGTVLAQSRTGFVTPENDNAGFARWVKANEAEWKKTAGVPTLWKEPGEFDHYLHVIFYGEWCGPGIQKKVALANLPKKCFAIFAMRAFGKNGEDVLFEADPNRIALYLGKSGVKFAHTVEPNLPDVYILPWYERSIDIDFKQTDEDLTKTIAPINEWVSEVETNDPWVEANFGIKGTGEGLVFYPVSKPHMGFENFQTLCFKAKGEKHKNIQTAAPVQVNPETAASVDAFVSLVLTQARLEQGGTATGYDLKLTPNFIQWCLTDVQKETTDEMEASGLTWDDVKKALAIKAREWYVKEAKIR